MGRTEVFSRRVWVWECRKSSAWMLDTVSRSFNWIRR